MPPTYSNTDWMLLCINAVGQSWYASRKEEQL